MSYTQLTRDDRIRMGLLRQQGKTPTEIAEVIKKHRSSIYRELMRNSCESGYFPETAPTFSYPASSRGSLNAKSR